MKYSIVLFVVLSFAHNVKGQEQVISLHQLIDSAIYNQRAINVDNYHLQNEIANTMSARLFAPAELSFRKGYLYSSEIEQEWRVRQELVAPVSWLYGKKIKENSNAMVAADSLVSVKQFIAELKKTYFLCVYRYALYNHNRMIFDLIDRMFSGISGDSIDVETNRMYSECILKIQDSYFDWLEAQNELRHMAGLHDLPIPADTVPELYQIEPVPDTLTRTPARLFYNSYIARLKYEDSYARWQKLDRWPSLFFDLSMRSNVNHQNLMAWQVGVRIPIASWINPRQSMKVSYGRNIAEYEWQKQKATLDYQSEKLIILMNKRFAQVNYYRNRILPQMENETYRIVNQILDNKLEFRSGISHFLSWQSYYADYLHAIYDYNCLAAELEVMAY